MSALALTGWGAPVAGVYFGINLVTSLIWDKSVGDLLNDAFGWFKNKFW